VNTLWKNVFSNSDLVLSSVFIPPSSSKIHGMLSLALVFDFINFQKILLSSFQIRDKAEKALPK
jgi:hypothetical protein